MGIALCFMRPDPSREDRAGPGLLVAQASSPATTRTMGIPAREFHGLEGPALHPFE